MDSREVIRKLKADGWYDVNPVKKGRATVPHPKRDLPIGTLKSIEIQTGIKLR
jgi:predicted RNA binding protein YcfA (HicA-like mRNA interferase family)